MGGVCGDELAWPLGGGGGLVVACLFSVVRGRTDLSEVCGLDVGVSSLRRLGVVVVLGALLLVWPGLIVVSMCR